MSGGSGSSHAACMTPADSPESHAGSKTGRRGQRARDQTARRRWWPYRCSVLLGPPRGTRLPTASTAANASCGRASMQAGLGSSTTKDGGRLQTAALSLLGGAHSTTVLRPSPRPLAAMACAILPASSCRRPGPSRTSCACSPGLVDLLRLVPRNTRRAMACLARGQGGVRTHSIRFDSCHPPISTRRAFVPPPWSESEMKLVSLERTRGAAWDSEAE